MAERDPHPAPRGLGGGIVTNPVQQIADVVTLPPKILTALYKVAISVREQELA